MQMTEKSLLLPGDMRAQCDSAIKILERNNESIGKIQNKLQDFIEDDELVSEAYSTLKKQISDYLAVTSAMISANDMDIADLQALKEAIGEDELRGDLILKYKNEACQEMNSFHNSAAAYHAKAASESWWSIERSWYLNIAAYYEARAAISGMKYEKWLAKQQKYEEIDSATQGLFIQSGSLREEAKKGLESITKAFQSGQYIIDKEAEWRKFLCPEIVGQQKPYLPSGGIQKTLDDIFTNAIQQAEEDTYYIRKYVNEETLCRINPQWEENMDTFKKVYGENVFEELRKYMYRYGITDEISILMLLATIGEETNYGLSVVQGQYGNPALGMVGEEEIPDVSCTLGVGLLQVTSFENQQNFIKYKYFSLDADSEERKIFENVLGEIAQNDDLDSEKTAGFICKYYPIESAMWFWAVYDDKGESANDFIVEYKDGNLFNVFYAVQGITNGTQIYMRSLKRIAECDTMYQIEPSSEYETGYRLFYEDEKATIETYGPYHWAERLEDWQNAEEVLKSEEE